MELTGTKIAGRYEIRELLSEGGMSYIYKAFDPVNNLPVAVQLLKPEFISGRLEDVIRFRNLIDILSKINHPNIPRIFSPCSPEESINPSTYCIIMELLSGIKLQKAIMEREFSVAEACEIVSQICRALTAVHGMGIIHGDIKPENILLSVTEENKTGLMVKLIDFGLSRIKIKDEYKHDYEISGTYFYMSPEQAGIVRRNVDERSDLYSLGVVFYRLLTGELPFTCDSMVQLLHEQAAKIPDMPSEKNKNLPAVLDAIVLKLLEKEPERRYQTAAGLLNDLELFLSGKRNFQIAAADSHSHFDFTGKMAGRDKELTRLLEIFENMRSGKGSICFITGEPGIGKTRLMEELKKYIFFKRKYIY